MYCVRVLTLIDRRSDRELTKDDLRAGLAAAQSKLNVATSVYIEAKTHGLHQIASFTRDLRRAPRDLQHMQRQSDEWMRGDICKLVLQRWWVERATEQAGGRVEKATEQAEDKYDTFMLIG